MLAALLTTVLFSFSAISGRRLAHHLRGTQANLTRLLVAAALTGVWSNWFGFGLRGANSARLRQVLSFSSSLFVANAASRLETKTLEQVQDWIEHGESEGS